MPALSAAQTAAAPTQAATLAVRLALAAAVALAASTQAAALAVPAALSAAQAAPLPAQAAALAVLLRLSAAQVAAVPTSAATATLTGEGYPAPPSGLFLAWSDALGAASFSGVDAVPYGGGGTAYGGDEWSDSGGAGGEMHLRLISGPAGEPITLAEAKAHLRVTTDADDTLISLWIAAAREQVEGLTGRALLPQTWELRIDRFPGWRRSVELPIAPLLAVQSIAYSAVDGTLLTVDASGYDVLRSGGPRAMPGRILLMPGALWPVARARDMQAVRITYQAGYADAASVPAALRSAVLLLLGELYESREASIPTRGASPQALSDNPAVRRLLDPFTIWNL